MRSELPLLLLLASGCAGTGDTVAGDDGSDSGLPPSDELTVNILSLSVEPELGSLVKVSWEQSAAGTATVEYQFDHHWIAAPSQEREAGAQEQVLLGIPYDTEVEVRVTVDDGQQAMTSPIAHIRTWALSDRVPAIVVLSGDADKWDADHPFVLLSVNAQGTDYGGPYFTLIIDRAGRVVWSMMTPETATTLWARPSVDGDDLLIDHNSFWTTFDSSGSTVQRMKIDGTVVETIDTPGMAHAFEEIDDGSFMWMVDDPEVQQLVLRLPTGELRSVWSCKLFFAKMKEFDACGTNSIHWDPGTDSLLLSFFSSETVVQLDRSSGEVLAWFGNVEGAWDFDPAESRFFWQHGATFTPRGHLLLSSKAAADAAETVVREYELDDETQTLHEVWSFGEGEGVYADTMGEAHRLPGGNTLHNYGSAARLREVSPEGEVVWDVMLGGKGQFVGRSTPLSDLYVFLPEATQTP